MSESSSIPFFHWGDFKSESSIDADRIAIEVTEAKPREGAYSTNITGNIDGTLKHIPLWNYNSKNQKLLRDYTKLYEKGKIKDGQQIEILTWLGNSSKNPEFKLREWRIIV